MAPILSRVWLAPRRWQLNSGAAQKAFNSEGGTRSHWLCRSRWQSTQPLEEGVLAEADCMKSTGDPGPSCKSAKPKCQQNYAENTFICPWVSCPEVDKSTKGKERDLVSKASFKVPKFRKRPTYDLRLGLLLDWLGAAGPFVKAKVGEKH